MRRDLLRDFLGQLGFFCTAGVPARPGPQDLLQQGKDWEERSVRCHSGLAIWAWKERLRKERPACWNSGSSPCSSLASWDGEAYSCLPSLRACSQPPLAKVSPLAAALRTQGRQQRRSHNTPPVNGCHPFPGIHLPLLRCLSAPAQLSCHWWQQSKNSFSLRPQSI